jgi:hypothetical protein
MYPSNITVRTIRYYRGADKCLVRPNSRRILFDGENISFDASLVMYINSTNILFDGENISFDASLVTYINSTNISPIMITNRIYETENLLSL